MFPLRSHLDAPHIATLAGQPNPVIAGLGDDTAPAPGTAVPAPLPTTSTAQRLLLVGGIAVAIYFLLRHLNKGKA